LCQDGQFADVDEPQPLQLNGRAGIVAWISLFPILSERPRQPPLAFCCEEAIPYGFSGINGLLIR